MVFVLEEQSPYHRLQRESRGEAAERYFFFNSFSKIKASTPFE